MSLFELVGHKLAVQAAPLQRGSGGAPVVSGSDLAAMLAGLPPGPVALGYAKFAGCPKEARKLYAMLHVIATGWAVAEKWQFPRGSERLYKLAMLVRDDLVLPRPSLSGRASANAVGVSESAWRDTWKDRHYRLLCVGLDWESDLARKLGREYYGMD